jgi:hypothetical protein
MTDLFAWADRADAIEAAADAAGEAWRATALEAIRTIARRQREVFVDEVRALFREPPPSGEERAWGQVWRNALRAGIIEPSSEHRNSARAKELGFATRPYPIYRSLIFEAARK